MSLDSVLKFINMDIEYLQLYFYYLGMIILVKKHFPMK